ncbi:MAG: hypothetical protein P8J78_03495 [Maricaulis sp.]|nr:hypothetical protein [Maricaulis sp.]
MNIFKPAFVVAAMSVSLSACSTLFPEQTVHVTSAEPGAEVYMSLLGNTSMGVNGPDVMGSIPTGTEQGNFLYIGEAPLSHTFQVNQYQQGLMVPGVANTTHTTSYTEAVIRLIHDDGSLEERRVRLNNGEISMSFNGSSAEAAK